MGDMYYKDLFSGTAAPVVAELDKIVDAIKQIENQSVAAAEAIKKSLAGYTGGALEQALKDLGDLKDLQEKLKKQNEALLNSKEKLTKAEIENGNAAKQINDLKKKYISEEKLRIESEVRDKKAALEKELVYLRENLNKSVQENDKAAKKKYENAIKLNEKELKATILKIEKIEALNIKAIEKEISQTQKALNAQAKAEATARESLEKQRSAAYQKMFADQQKAAAAAQKEAEAIRQQTELLSREARSIAELQKQNNLLMKQRREMVVITKEDEKARAQLTKVIEQNQNRLKAFDAEIGNYQRNVGNYTSAWEGMPGALGATGQAVSGVGQAFKALLANPIVALFAALAAVLGALVNAFMQTERGASVLRKGMAYLDAGMNLLINLSNKLADAIIFVFENPQKALENFGQMIKDYLIDRINNAVELFANFGGVIKNVWAGNFDKAAESAKKMGANILDAVSGGTFEAATKGAKELATEVELTAKKFEDLAKAQIENEKLNQRLAVSIEKLRAEEQLLIDTADNDKLAFEDRIKAATAYEKVANERAKQTKQLANANVAIIQQEMALNQGNYNKMRELNQRLADAKLAQVQAEAEVVQTRRDSLEKIAMLDRDYFEQQLDYLIDYSDSYTNANAAIINNEKTTQAERIKLLTETQSYAQSQWEKQKKLIEAQAAEVGGQIDLEAMLAEKDAEKVQRMAEMSKLDEVEKNRVLQTLIARRASVQALADLEQAVSDKAKKAKEDAIRLEREQLAKKQALDAANFEGTKATEKAKSDFVIKQKIETYEKEIELAEKYPGLISDIELQTLKKNLENAKKEVSAIPSVNILEKVFSLKEGDGVKMWDAIKATWKAGTDALNDMVQGAVDKANRLVEARKKAVEESQATVDKERELAAQGVANNYESALKDLENKKKLQAEAIKEQEKAQKRQQAIDTATQLSNMITAGANIWKEATKLGPWGYVLAGIQTIAMLASFVAMKRKAKEATSTQYGRGGVIEIGGGTHASGDDTTLYYDKKRNHSHKVERGELVSVYSATASQRYGNVIRSFTNAINGGTFKAVQMPQVAPETIDYTRFFAALVQNTTAKKESNVTTQTHVIGNKLVEIKMQNGVVVSRNFIEIPK